MLIFIVLTGLVSVVSRRVSANVPNPRRVMMVHDDYDLETILSADSAAVPDPLNYTYSHNKLCYMSLEVFEEGACYGEQERGGQVECTCVSRHLPWDPDEDSRARGLMVGAQRRLQGLSVRELPGENEPEIPEGQEVS